MFKVHVLDSGQLFVQVSTVHGQKVVTRNLGPWGLPEVLTAIKALLEGAEALAAMSYEMPPRQPSAAPAQWLCFCGGQHPQGALTQAQVERTIAILRRVILTDARIGLTDDELRQLGFVDEAGRVVRFPFVCQGSARAA